MNKLDNNGLAVKKSTISGLGVFAECDFAAGSVIEKAPVLISRKNQDSDLIDYYFSLASDINGLVLGYGSLYNHSSTPNVEYNYEPNSRLMVYTSLRPILKGEELFIHYGNKWFERRGLVEQSSWYHRLYYTYPWVRRALRFLSVAAVVFVSIYLLRALS